MYNFTQEHWSISIHALREEGDRLPARSAQMPPPISIHALREEGDQSGEGSSGG